MWACLNFYLSSILPAYPSVHPSIYHILIDCSIIYHLSTYYLSTISIYLPTINHLSKNLSPWQRWLTVYIGGKLGDHTGLICICFFESTRFWKLHMLQCPRQLFNFLLWEAIGTWVLHPPQLSVLWLWIAVWLTSSRECTIEHIDFIAYHLLPASPPSAGLSEQFGEINHSGCQSSSWCFWLLRVGHDQENISFSHSAVHHVTSYI